MTPADRQQLGTLEKAFQPARTIGMWMRLHNVSPHRAVIDLAMRLGFADRHTANWLLAQLGGLVVLTISLTFYRRVLGK